MAFYSKHIGQRVLLAASGLLVSSFGPTQVPVPYQPILFWLGIGMAIFAVFVWPLASLAFQSRISERHKAILLALVEPLARVQELAMVYGQRDLTGFTAAKAEAEGLVAQIPYDQPTSQTVRDFLNACGMLVGDFQMHSDERENREIVHRMSIGLFRYLHQGKPVNRRKIEMPDWMRLSDDKAAKPKPLSGPKPAQPKMEAGYHQNQGAVPGVGFDEAFKERSDDRIPFVRIRDLAPAYGLGLGSHDPDSSNVAYRIEGALRQAAVDGDLKVWGRRYRSVPSNEPLVPIPSLHFEDYEFAHGNLHYAVDNKEARTSTLQMATWGQKGKTGATYYDLQLSLSDTEAVLSKVSKGEA